MAPVSRRPKEGANRRKPNDGMGRPKGALNVLTRSAKEAFQYAFDANGGQEGLARWATKHPAEFYKIYARLIPTQRSVDIQQGSMPLLSEAERAQAVAAILRDAEAAGIDLLGPGNDASTLASG